MVGGLIVLALTVVLVAPYFVDWTSYRAEFEREASRILGRRVTVAGEATARLLPFPSVTFTDVKVAGDTPDAPSLTVETFSMDVELAPFMRGEILIFDMRLGKPRLTVDVADNGLIDWTIRPNTPFDPSQITLEKISVTEGAITVHHAAGGRDYVLDAINADISARTLAGPWRIKGALRFDGSPMDVAISTGTLRDDGAMRLRFNVTPEALPVAIETDGDVRIADGGAVYQGLFRLQARETGEGDDSDDDASAFAISVEEDKKQPVIPFRVSGRFSVDHRLVDISEFLFETGDEIDPYTADGTAFFDFGDDPRFSIRAEGRQVRFGDGKDGGPGALPLIQRIALFRDLVQSLPRPQIPGTVDFDLPAIIAGDTTIRQVKLSAQPADEGWSIAAFSAELPGRATLEADGLLATGAQFGFHGSLLLAISQPSGFAAWLADDVDEAVRRLPAAGFSARVDLDAERQTFRDLELILGAARFTGELDHLVPSGARPSMLMRLDGGALDLDGLAAFASIFIDDRGAARFAEHDLDLVVKAGPVSVAGLTAESVDTALRLKNGLLDIDRLSIAELAGATVSATGKVRNFPESPTGNIDASVVAVDLEPLVALVAARYPRSTLAAILARRAAAFPDLLGDTRIDLVASGASNDDGSVGLAISANGATGGSRFTLSGSATALDGRLHGPFTTTLTMHNGDAAPLFAAYGLPAVPLGLTGPAETSLTMSGKADGLFDTQLVLRGEATEMTFDGRTGMVDGAWRAEGRAQVSSDDVEPWLATAGLALPGFGYGLPLDIRADIDQKDGELAITGLGGTADGGPVEAVLTARFDDTMPAVSGTITVPSLDLSSLGGMLLGDDTLGFDETEKPRATPFAAAARFPFGAELDLTVGDLGIGLADPLRNVALRLAVDHDSIRVSGLKADYRDGRLAGIAEARNNGGTALVSAQMRYEDARLAELAGAQSLGGKATLSANLTANGKSFAGLVSSLSGSGTATVTAPVIPAVNPDVFDAFIGKADEIGRDIDAADVAGFAPGLIASGPFAATAAEFTFVVAGGVVRTPAILFKDDKARLEAQLTTDLNTGEAAVAAEIAYDPGREALVGAVPAVRIASQGRIGAMAAVYDTAPLAQFLTQRALEIEQFRVESLQAGLLEKQRLRREARYYASLRQARLEETRAEDTQTGEPAGEAAAVTNDGSGKAVSPPADNAGRTLEDDIRRVLDEEARKRTEEGALAEPDGAVGDVVSVGPVPQPRPDPDAVEDGNADDGGASSSAFDPLSIDRFLRSLNR
ncbi:MAG: AsmA-like C-terminal region-containing protein [Rhizobiaceae bacterium]